MGPTECPNMFVLVCLVLLMLILYTIEKHTVVFPSDLYLSPKGILNMHWVACAHSLKVKTLKFRTEVRGLLPSLWTQSGKRRNFFCTFHQLTLTLYSCLHQNLDHWLL